jgi:hypothetical protein
MRVITTPTAEHLASLAANTAADHDPKPSPPPPTNGAGNPRA